MVFAVIVSLYYYLILLGNLVIFHNKLDYSFGICDDIYNMISVTEYLKYRPMIGL